MGIYSNWTHIYLKLIETKYFMLKTFLLYFYV
jgi:hypothetical protein